MKKFFLLSSLSSLAAVILLAGCVSAKDLLPTENVESYGLYQLGSPVPEDLKGCIYAEIRATVNEYYGWGTPYATRQVDLRCKIYKDKFSQVMRSSGSRYEGPFRIEYIIAAE